MGSSISGLTGINPLQMVNSGVATRHPLTTHAGSAQTTDNVREARRQCAKRSYG
jgi:hypothetical protein